MSISPVSSIEDLKSALLSQNPFNEVSVRYQNVWGQGFPDVEALNAHASNAVFQAIEQNRTTSIVITAEYGTGKTHIISRIRHRLQEQGGALFVYANKYGNLKQIKQEFQVILADSLRNIGSQGVRQWQELAASMANQANRVIDQNTQSSTPKELVDEFENSEPEQVKKRVNQLTRAFCKTKDVSNPDIVRAIFWTLSDEQVLYASNWLAGQELAQFNANELRLPIQNQSFDAVLQILDLISEYKALVICFDELDNIVDLDPDTGLVRAQFVAGLIKELFENLKRGVILSVMLPNVWKHKIKYYGSSSTTLPWHKVSDYGEPIDLKFMDEISVLELVTLRLREFYQTRRLVPPQPVYPFTESQLRNIGRTKASTVREVLTWCKDNLLKILDEDMPPPLLPVEQAFNEELEEEIQIYLGSNSLIADALLFSFQRLIGQTVEGILVEEVTDKVTKKGGKDKHLNFKIIGKEEGKDVSIGVAVLQQDGGQTLGAGLRRLTNPQKYSLEITRSCLVRSETKGINSHFEKTYLKPLRESGGEHVPFKEEEIKPLIAIHSVYDKRTLKNLNENETFKFIAEEGIEKNLGASNPLLKEILSKPS